MRYLLDTNAIIAIMKGHAGMTARLKQHQPSDFAMSSIVAHELYYGAWRSQRTQENLRRVEALRFDVLDLDREDARHAGQLRAMLAAQGTPIGPYDVLIAGQAWARGLTLISRNMREFQRLPQIQVQNWED
ncbi:type II toxin-antitoxin system VapC family toxin [Ottowia caeni]|uniref:type II toxin-antitoxin system VapC family toxin n=1 Tax=Ottowia caeni TaxID=2870339 RepID=UPI001E2B8F74|nr:type II toxin-antitoxin system VapC family toxin [Ottowia caeni]